MINIDQNSRIYVFCPEKKETGGTELAHQLVDYLRNKLLDAYIVYVDTSTNSISVKPYIPESFLKYNIKIADHIEDVSNNLLVIPETLLLFVNRFEKIQFIFWWMSVYFYFRSADIRELPFYSKNPYFIAKIIYRKLLNKEKLFNSISFHSLKKEENRSLHVYQSVYAQNYLLKRGVTTLLPLSDYINTEFINKKIENVAKEDIILYNPAKGFLFTKKIIKRLPHLKFIPLQGLSRSELGDLFSIAKLYIDFGDHPGKDRIPREAVINNCCIITGKKGAAKFFEDIPIPPKYKFEDQINSLPKIVEAIEDILRAYDDRVKDFLFYKNRILKEQQIFYQQIEDIFCERNDI